MISPIDRLAAALADRYRLERELGQGGMATVYLAQDLKHDRQVAIKVLHEELGAVLGAERFLAEIKTTARLQHPHILPLLDSGEAGGLLFYVMPFVTGETLRARLERETQLPVADALRIAREVADALAEAHGRGVVHRDIKPENILLQGNHALVADFGIALAVQHAGGARMTQTGLSLGTPQYMAPEQAMGDKAVDHRADVYALGAVTYEMLTGEPPHTGANVQAIVAKLLTERVRPVRVLRPAVPDHVDATLQVALQKLPADRFGSVAEFSAALGNPGFTVTTEMTAGAAAGRGEHDWRLIGLSAALLAMTVVAAWALLRPVPPQPVSRYSVRLPDGQSFSGLFARIALTPDGSQLVYVVGETDVSGQTELWVRGRDQLEGTLLPGTSGAVTPFVSPQGDRVGFLGQGFLRVVSLRGGPAVTLADSLVGTAGGTWSSNGFIYADGVGAAPLARVSAAGGGAPEWFTQLDSTKGEVDHLFPDALPNGRGVLFVVGYGTGGTRADDRNIAVAHTTTGEHRVLLRGVYVRYASTGHLVYVTSEGSLLAVPFDQDAMEVTGEPVALTSGITLRTIAVPDLTLANDGTLMYTVGGAARRGGEPTWVTRNGQATPVALDWTRSAQSVSLSPDGSQLATAIADNTDTHLWVRQLARGTATKLTFSGSINYRPSWTPDGRSVLFISNGGGSPALHSQRADGTAAPEILVHSQVPVQEGLVTGDGQWLVYRRGGGSTGNLYARRTSGDTTQIELATTAFSEATPAVSPDGHWLAYVAAETERSEVYIRPFPEVAGGKWLVSTAGGSEPVWSRDGRELFYRNGNSDMVAVEVLPIGAPPTGQQRVLFSATDYAADQFHQMYDVSRDGRFVMLRLGQTDLDGEARLIVVENFFEELKRLVPR